MASSTMKQLYLILLYTHFLWINNVQGQQGTLQTDPPNSDSEILKIPEGELDLGHDETEITRCRSQLSNTLFNQAIRLAVSSLKNRLPDGIPEYGIPPLEPLDVDPMYIPISKIPVEVNAALKEIKVWNLTTFSKTNWFLDVRTRILDMTIVVPTLLATGQFTLLPIGIKGNISIIFESVEIKAKTRMKVVNTSREQGGGQTHIKADRAVCQIKFDKIRIRMTDLFPEDDKEYAKINYALRVFTERYSELLYEEAKPYVNAGTENIILGIADAVLNSAVFQRRLPAGNGILPGINLSTLTNWYDDIRDSLSVKLPTSVKQSGSYRSLIGLLEDAFKACQGYTDVTDQLTNPLINLFGFIAQ